MNSDARNLRLRVTQRDEPDLRRLVAWVLGIADARHSAWVNGEPDPYGLGLPDGIGPESSRSPDGSGKFPGPSAPKATAPHGTTVVDIFHHRPWELLQAIEDPSPSEGTRHEHHHRPY